MKWNGFQQEVCAIVACREVRMSGPPWHAIKLPQVGLRRESCYLKAYEDFIHLMNTRLDHPGL